MALNQEHVWNSWGGRYERECGNCGEPMSLEVMVRKCQAGQARWGNQPPSPLDQHEQATMSD